MPQLHFPLFLCFDFFSSLFFLFRLLKRFSWVRVAWYIAMWLGMIVVVVGIVVVVEVVAWYVALWLGVIKVVVEVVAWCIALWLGMGGRVEIDQTVSLSA